MRQAEYPRPPDPGSTKIKDNQGAHRDLILDGLDLGPWAQIWPMGPFGSLGPKPGPVNKYGPKFGSGPKIARKTIDPPLRRRVFFEGVCLTAVILASGAENLGSEVPAVHHFRFIRWIRWIGWIGWIRFQIPSGSQTVKNRCF